MQGILLPPLKYERTCIIMRSQNINDIWVQKINSGDIISRANILKHTSLGSYSEEMEIRIKEGCISSF